MSILALHLEKTFGVSKSDMGYYFMIASASYLPSCVLMPKYITKTPPKVQMVAGFLLLVGATALMGPSDYFFLPNELWIICVGLFFNGIFIVPSFILCLPESDLETRLKFNIVEGVDTKLDGILADN